jgi:hemerythrin-like domain-containing protein
MCEYCGCQSVEVIAELTGEHEAVVNMFADVRAKLARADIPGAAATARAIASILGPHAAVEERGLFPLLSVDFPDQVAVLAAEHRAIEAVLDEAADTVPVDPAWPHRLLDALDLLRDHILKEEDSAFPAALATLSSDDWETVEAARRAVSSGALRG